MKRVGTLPLLLLLAACEGGEGGIAFSEEAAWPQESLLPPAGGPRLVVTNSGEDTVSFIDAATFTEVGRVPVGIFPVELEGAHHAAVTPDGRHVFVGIANALAEGAEATGPHGNHGTGTADGYLIKMDAITGRQVGRVRVERSPGDVRLQPGSNRIWQSHYDLVTIAEVGATEEAFSSVIVTDADTLERVARVPICLAGHGIGFAADGSEAYVSCGWGDEVAIVDTADFVVERIPLADDAGLGGVIYDPYALTVAPDGKVWVSNTRYEPNTPSGTPLDNRGVRVLDPSTRTMIEGLGLDTEGTPLFGDFTEAGDRFYLPTQAPDLLLAIDPATATVTETVDLAALGCENAHAAVISPDESELWVVCEGDRLTTPGTLERFELPSLTPTGHLTLGLFPDDVVYLPEAR